MGALMLACGYKLAKGKNEPSSITQKSENPSVNAKIIEKLEQVEGQLQKFDEKLSDFHAFQPIAERKDDPEITKVSKKMDLILKSFGNNQMLEEAIKKQEEEAKDGAIGTPERVEEGSSNRA